MVYERVSASGKSGDKNVTKFDGYDAYVRRNVTIKARGIFRGIIDLGFIFLSSEGIAIVLMRLLA